MPLLNEINVVPFSPHHVTSSYVRGHCIPQVARTLHNGNSSTCVLARYRLQPSKSTIYFWHYSFLCERKCIRWKLTEKIASLWSIALLVIQWLASNNDFYPTADFSFLQSKHGAVRRGAPPKSTWEEVLECPAIRLLPLICHRFHYCKAKTALINDEWFFHFN